MDPSRIDAISKFFAERQLSRRQALAGGAGLAAAGLVAAGLPSAQAQVTTPVPLDVAEQDKTEFLFVQSFRQGSLAVKDASKGTYTLTLEHGLGQTIYFSDRPERIVGTSPTAEFLKGLGFAQDNPPNAALVYETAPGDEVITVAELFNPRYDTATNTATYDVTPLPHDTQIGLTFQSQPDGLALIGRSFGTAHLFIDDCPDSTVACCAKWNFYTLECEAPYVGQIGPMGYCYNWDAWHCQPCIPYGHNFPACKDVDDCPLLQYWENQCNQTFGACNGICEPVYYP